MSRIDKLSKRSRQLCEYAHKYLRNRNSKLTSFGVLAKYLDVSPAWVERNKTVIVEFCSLYGEPPLFPAIVNSRFSSEPSGSPLVPLPRSIAEGHFFTEWGTKVPLIGFFTWTRADGYLYGSACAARRTHSASVVSRQEIQLQTAREVGFLKESTFLKLKAALETHNTRIAPRPSNQIQPRRTA